MRNGRVDRVSLITHMFPNLWNKGCPFPKEVRLALLRVPFERDSCDTLVTELRARSTPRCYIAIWRPRLAFVPNKQDIELIETYILFVNTLLMRRSIGSGIRVIGELCVPNWHLDVRCYHDIDMSTLMSHLLGSVGANDAGLQPARSERDSALGRWAALWTDNAPLTNPQRSLTARNLLKCP